MATTTIEQPQDVGDAASNRRKACDLCFLKKIKCDMLKPICSNCTLYSAECRTSSIRRKTAREKQRAAKPQPQSQQPSPDGEDTESLKARLARIEKQLQAVLEGAKHEHSITSSLSSRSPPSDFHPEHICNDYVSTMEPKEATWRFDPLAPSLYHGPSVEGLPLPHQDRIMPVIDHYFNTLNQMVPLFHQPTFMRMLNGWYKTPATRNKPTWAAILIVAALGLRAAVPGDPEQSEAADKTEWANFCMRNAQSVMSDLVMREEDLLGLQVLLGLVRLFLHSSDSRPAGILIGTAMRLVHRMQLHSGAVNHLFSAEEVLQRQRLFWIAYTLDKDISLRTKMPSLQDDTDIDIPLPALNPPDNIGLIWTLDGRTKFNHFRMCLDLAHIEGKIYDLLWSNKAIKVQGPEREQRVKRLSSMLHAWSERIPVPFRVENVSATVGELEQLHMVKLHHAYLLAIISVNGVYSTEAEWMRRVGSLNRVAIQDFAHSMVGHGKTSCTEHQMPPETAGWEYCVDLSRKCMTLFQESSPSECLIWQCTCPYFSSLIILLANILISPNHPAVSIDQQLTLRAMNLFDKILEVVRVEVYHSLRRIIQDLHVSATKAVNETRLQQLTDKAGGGLDSGAASSEDIGIAEEIGFPTFTDLGVDVDGTGSLDWESMLDPAFAQEHGMDMALEGYSFTSLEGIQ